MRLRPLLRLLLLAALLVQVGCSALLPRSKSVAESPWMTYEEVKEAFDKIEVGSTTKEDLKRLGFSITSPNVKELNYLEVAATVQTMRMDQLDPGLQACLAAKSDCKAYHFEPRRTATKRVGNFWLDITNFRRQTQETGWNFKALIVFVNHRVAYKLSSGEPKIDQFQEQVNPLGFFQLPTNMIYGIIP